MFQTARNLYDSSYYGYINSDILLSPSLFDALSICLAHIQTGVLDTNVKQSSLFIHNQFEIAGRVHETPTYSKVDISNMTTYLDYLEKASQVMRPMRNQHSAVY